MRAVCSLGAEEIEQRGVQVDVGRQARAPTGLDAGAAIISGVWPSGS